MTTVGGDVDVVTLGAAQRAEVAAQRAEHFATRNAALDSDTDVQIGSDSRLNPIFIKDLAYRMPIYEHLIASLALATPITVDRFSLLSRIGTLKDTGDASVLAGGDPRLPRRLC